MTGMNTIVSRNLTALRVERGWSQTWVAKRLTANGAPIHQTFVSKIERGTQPITVDQLAAFAYVYGVAPTKIIEGVDCARCHGWPPAGFTCNNCGVTT